MAGGLLFAFPLITNAVSPSAESIHVSVVPQNPNPGENTSITLSSYSAKLDSILISWSVNGKNVLSGIGKKSLSLSAPTSGGEARVVATVALPNNTVEKIIIVKPSIATLLWQANASYVPPFYKGKALPGPGSGIKVVFMPEINSGSQLINPKTMTYSWKKDYTNNPDSSGYGKNFFVYTSDYLDDSNNISVKASTVDQKYETGAAVDIITFAPKLVFYKHDLTRGTLWEKALLDGHKIISDEIIEAVPYFISSQNIKNPILAWDWSINGSPIDTNSLDKNLMPVKVQSGVSGTSKIKLEINNIYKIFETASKELSVEF
ncbi:MAG: hypothetical protein WC609_01080 [Candidatus Paceibacterota bacterium]